MTEESPSTAEELPPGITVEMPLYQGTKVLRALPMTRGEYNAYRAWAHPEGEDQSVPGYLVEYVDGGEPNDERHSGYISWSPADVFGAHYKPCGSYAERLKIEWDELNERLDKLFSFISTDPLFEALQKDAQALLRAQHSAMASYAGILGLRLEAANA